MKKLLAIFLTAMLIMTFAACGGTTEPSAPTWQEQYDLGVRYLSEGNYQEAIIAFTAAIEIDPRNPGAYLGRAGAYIASGETKENLSAARADYEEARDIDRTSPEAWLGLADVHIRQEEFDEAQAVLEEALEATGSDPAIVEKLEEMTSGSITDASGKIRRTNGYDGSGNLVWYHIYDYDAQGRESMVTSYDAAGSQTGQIEYRYDEEGRRLIDYHYDVETGEMAPVEYQYDEVGNVLRADYYENDGILIWYEINTYNGDGKKLRSDEYSPDGVLEGYETYEYDEEGRQTRRNRFDPDGTFSGGSVREYDVDGRLTKTEYVNQWGASGYDLYFRDQDGAITRIESYDGNGNLTGTTTYGD